MRPELVRLRGEEVVRQKSNRNGYYSLVGIDGRIEYLAYGERESTREGDSE